MERKQVGISKLQEVVPVVTEENGELFFVPLDGEKGSTLKVGMLIGYDLESGYVTSVLYGRGFPIDSVREQTLALMEEAGERLSGTFRIREINSIEEETEEKRKDMLERLREQAFRVAERMDGIEDFRSVVGFYAGDGDLRVIRRVEDPLDYFTPEEIKVLALVATYGGVYDPVSARSITSLDELRYAGSVSISLPVRSAHEIASRLGVGMEEFREMLARLREKIAEYGISAVLTHLSLPEPVVETAREMAQQIRNMVEGKPFDPSVLDEEAGARRKLGRVTELVEKDEEMGIAPQ